MVTLIACLPSLMHTYCMLLNTIFLCLFVCSFLGLLFAFNFFSKMVEKQVLFNSYLGKQCKDRTEADTLCMYTYGKLVIYQMQCSNQIYFFPTAGLKAFTEYLFDLLVGWVGGWVSGWLVVGLVASICLSFFLLFVFWGVVGEGWGREGDGHLVLFSLEAGEV